METVQILLSFGTLIAVILSIVSFFSSRKKDQSELDKQQDLEISVMKEKQSSFEQRIAKLEGQHETLDSRLAKEVEKVFNKITDVEKTLSTDIKDLNKTIQNINLNK